MNSLLYNNKVSLKNSTIYKVSEEHHIFDLSLIGTFEIIKDREIIQEKHYFRIGDVLYYDIKNKKFDLAVASNTVASEVAGLVSKVIDDNTFILTNTGALATDRYTFSVGTQLYLSDIVPGKLISIQPATVVKPIATQAENGIIVNIKRGWKQEGTEPSSGYGFYTQEELDEIISNVW